MAKQGTPYADLVLSPSRPWQSISWGDKSDLYWAEMSYSRPDDKGQVTPARGQVRIPLTDLLAASAVTSKYGLMLCDAIFGNQDLKDFYNLNLANAAELDMRLRIQIDSSAPELHGLHWETIADPNDPGLHHDPFLSDLSEFHPNTHR